MFVVKIPAINGLGKTKGCEKAGNAILKSLEQIHSNEQGVPVDVRLFERLFLRENPNETEDGKDFTDYINPDSLKTIEGCKAEPGMADAKEGEFFQFLRQGYFCLDQKLSTPERRVFNRTVSLRDSWAKISKKF